MDSQTNTQEIVCAACKQVAKEPVEIKAEDGHVEHVLCAECAKEGKKCEHSGEGECQKQE